MSDDTGQDGAGTQPVARVLFWWHRIEKWLAFVAFLFISVVIIYDVLSREILTPLLRVLGLQPNLLVVAGASKMGVYALIVGAFIGLGVATQAGAQIVPKVAFNWAPSSWVPALNRISDVFAGLFFAGATWYATVFVLSSRQYGMLTSGGINIEVWTIQTVMPLGFASIGLRYLAYAIWPAHRPVLPEISE